MKIIILNIILFFTPFLIAQNYTLNDSLIDRKQLEFDYSFIEGNKQFLLGNTIEAIKIFKNCLKQNSSNSAVYYQLSNAYIRLDDVKEALKNSLMACNIDNTNKWYIIQTASLYYFLKNVDSTIYYYERLLQIDKKNLDFKYKLALLYKEQKMFDDALSLIEILENNIGYTEEFFLLKHDIYYEMGKKDKAFDEIKVANSFFPNNLKIIEYLIYYYNTENNFSETKKLFEFLIACDSLEINNKIKYGEFLYKNKKDDESFKIYMNLYTVKSNNISAVTYSLINLINENEFSENEIFFQRIIDSIKNVDTKEYLLVCLSIQLRKKNYNDAEKNLLKLIEIEKDNYYLFEKFLFVENILKKYDTIIKFAEKKIKVFENKPIFYIILGCSYFYNNEFEKCVSILENGLRYLENVEQEFQVYTYLAEAYFKLYDYVKTNFYFEKLLKIDNTNLVVKNNYAYYLALQNFNLDKALKISKLTIVKEKKNSTFLDTYGWILYKKDKKNKAKRYLERALKFSTYENSEIYDHYGDILNDIGKKKEALINWKKSYELSKNKNILRKIEEMNK